MVLSVVSRGGDAWANVHQLIADSAQTPEEKIKLNARADEIFGTLLEAGVVVRETDAEGNPSYVLTVDLPEDFALDQPLSRIPRRCCGPRSARPATPPWPP